MKNDLTLPNAITLIAKFCTPLGGCYAEEVEDNVLYSRFIKAGYATLDEDHGDKYLINDNGVTVLRPFAEQIVPDFVTFMGRYTSLCPIAEIEQWFWQKYGLDKETAEEITDYFCNMLERFSDKYIARPAWNSELGKGYYIEKII